jgi:hypothetical protein
MMERTKNGKICFNPTFMMKFINNRGKF